MLILNQKIVAAKTTPINRDLVNKAIKESGIISPGKASIRELTALVNRIEEVSGEKFIRMEMGVPDLEPSKIAYEAEMKALQSGVASKYPMLEGVPKLKKEASRFVKNFLNTNVPEECCIPTVGSMQGGMAAFLMASRLHKEKDTILFIDPGFPAQKTQLEILSIKYEAFDVYNYRGEKLKDKLESYFKKGNIAAVVYSNPNNPSWICFSEKELETIGLLATEYGVVVIEDLAYFAMDFRNDYGTPGVPPFQPTVSQYTDSYLLLISSSKAFSYAGQRIAFIAISPKLAKMRFPDLKRYFAFDEFLRTIIFGVMYALSSGVAHSVQYGYAALLEAANNGTYRFLNDVKVYGEKAKLMKKLFTDDGFKIVYDMDEDKPIADGFYFTIAYPGMSSEELIENMLCYGICAISLAITGSERSEGLRACASQIQFEQMPVLEERLKQFHHDFSKA
ncbi:MAG: pyridoxal phosphate-dependent aminotransferase [Prevotellaceae bacterium]|jgi:aspartate/methionine/tyrosine aminotransferase|nr:pyridoxal phosphate-dependent aminotransferase [Prevotellaceae bacterium]